MEKLQAVCLKRVALAYVSGLHAALEPAYTLNGAAVGRGVRSHLAAIAALEPVIADAAGGVEGFFDVTFLENSARFISMVGSDSGKTVCLQFHQNGQFIGLRLAHLAAQGVNLFGDSQQILNVMAHFVGDDISLGEFSRGAKPALQIVVKAQIDVQFMTRGAVKRANSRRGVPAGGLHCSGKKHQGGFFVGLSHSAKECMPSVFRDGEHH